MEPYDLANVDLSSSEMAFAFLIDSFRVAVDAINDIIIASVKANYPNSWNEVDCCCFSAAVKRHVKEPLDNTCSLENRYQLNDVIGYVGGELLDPRSRERLSLQGQGVEVARHMVFHGECVSLSEVQSRDHLLISLLTAFRCRVRHHPAL